MRLPWQRRRQQQAAAEEAALRLLSSPEQQIRNLNALPLFLPLEQHVVGRVLPVVALTSLTLTALYAAFHYGVSKATTTSRKDDRESNWLLPNDDDDDNGRNDENGHVPRRSNATEEDTPPQQLTRRKRRRKNVHKLCYQLTNMSVNLFLGSMGAYYQYWHVPSYQSTKVANTIVGHDSWAVLAAVQIGYQLWSLPVGIWHVGESPAMLLHHVAVLVVASMSAFLTAGFRYWTPFFYGIIELSSVPLAIMNMFKDRPIWVRQFPTFYTAIRLLFCATFLTVRVFMFVPRKIVYLRDHYLLWSSAWMDHSRAFLYVVFMATVWASSVFLLGLQLHWGLLIVRGLLKLVVGGKGKTIPDNKESASSDKITATANGSVVHGALKPKTQ